jgi:hypothetical protein
MFIFGFPIRAKAGPPGGEQKVRAKASEIGAPTETWRATPLLLERVVQR